MKKIMRFLLAAVAVVLGMTSCDEFKSFMDNPVNSHLEISETTVTMLNGTTYDLKVTTLSDQPITFTSSDEKVVTVSAQGVVEAVGVGTATVTVSVAGNDISAASTKEVAVEVLPAMKDALENGAKIGFAFNLNGVDVEYLFQNQEGEFVEIPQNQMQQGAPRRAVVESQLIPVLIYDKTSNTLILTINQQVDEEMSLVLMVIFNLNDNTIQIIPGNPLTKVLNFKVRIGNVEVTASLKKKEVAPTGISLNKSELELVVDQPEALVAYVEPLDATDKSVTWTSDKPEVATVDANGKVTAIAAGEANITAQIGQFSATCKVTVAPAVNPNAYLAWNGKQKKLVATAIPEGATKVTSSTTTWSAGTYVVEGQVDIDGTIELSGAVELIIKDGAKLTVYGQIDGGTNKLYIYGQAGMSGELVVNNSDDNAISDLSTLEVHSAKVKATSSCDYHGGIVSIVAFNVYDGSVEAKGTAANGYGIHLNEGGSMNIYGGEVKAEGKGDNALCCYGIMCDNSKEKTSVTVHGGKLWAGCAGNKALYSNITLAIDKSPSFNVEIECSSDNSNWKGTVGTPDSKYVRVGY